MVLTNGQYSLRPIHNELVEWYKTTNDKIVFFTRSLSEVVQEIEKKTESRTHIGVQRDSVMENTGKTGVRKQE